MSEFGQDNNPERPALRLLDNELRRTDRTYGDIIIAFDSYIQTELGLADDSTEKVLQDMREEGVLPGLDLFDYDRTLAIEQFRLVIWRYVTPLAEGLMDEEELDIWLPRAIKIIAPRDGRHLPDRCRRTPGVNSSCCVLGNCPVMTINESLEQHMMAPDFSALEYTLHPIKARRNHLRRLSVSMQHGLVPPEFATVLDMRYRALCDEAFQGHA